MKSKQDQEHLLEEVLCESLPDGFREATLQQTLRLVRRRRRFRQTYRSAYALAAAVFVGFIGYAFWPRHSLVKPVAPVYETIQSRPFPASAIVSSKPLRPEQLAAPISTVSVIHTRRDRSYYRDITDDELLALIANRSGLLVRVGPREQKLLFANEADQRGFPPN